MRCPAGCDATLVMSERQGVEIDYCPVCRGVWLDRGELDKIIERADAENRSYRNAPPPPQPPFPSTHTDHRWWPPPKRKKRESFLSEIFDFG